MQKIFTHDGRFCRYQYKKEKELEEQIDDHFHEVFGERVEKLADQAVVDTILGSKAVPDAFAIDLSEPTSPKLLLIEFELAVHDPYHHIGSQVIKFKSVLKRSKEKLLRVLKNRKPQRVKFESLYDAIYKNPARMVIVIDNATEEVKTICSDENVELIEFQTFIKELSRGLSQEHIHQVVSSFEKEEGIDIALGWNGFIARNCSTEEAVGLAKNIEEAAETVYRSKGLSIVKEFDRFNLLLYQKGLTNDGHSVAINPMKIKLNLYLDLSNFDKSESLIRRTRQKGYEIKDLGDEWYRVSISRKEFDAFGNDKSTVREILEATTVDFDARYHEGKQKFSCAHGDGKNCSKLYDAEELVRHLNFEHGIHPDDQVIEEWSDELENQIKGVYEEIEKRKKRKK